MVEYMFADNIQRLSQGLEERSLINSVSGETTKP